MRRCGVSYERHAKASHPVVSTEALWLVIHAPSKAIPSGRVNHATASLSPYQPRGYMVSKQYIEDHAPCPFSTWMGLPPHDLKFHLRFHIYFLGLKWMLQQGRVSSKKAKNGDETRPL